MLSSILLAACVLAAGGESDQSVASSSRSASEPTPLYVLSRETSEALRREAVAQEPAEKAQAIRGLCELHTTLRSDPRYEQVDKLKDLRGRIYSRLRRVQLDLKREIAKSEPTKGGAARAKGGAVASLEPSERELAALAASDRLATSLALLDATAGGPAALVGLGGRGVQDNGQALVDLIERTINPTFWDTVGGPGSIVYFQPLQCIVVRASGDVHERIGAVLGGLQAAGR